MKTFFLALSLMVSTSVFSQQYLGQLSKNPYNPKPKVNFFAQFDEQDESTNFFSQFDEKKRTTTYSNPFTGEEITNTYSEPTLYDSAGNYRGRLSEDKYSLDSISNPYGRYGSEYSLESINNPYGAGSEYKLDSPNNPYGEGWGVYSNDYSTSYSVPSYPTSYPTIEYPSNYLSLDID